jgi:hypothetical protein
LPVIVSSPCLSLPAQQGIRFTGASSQKPEAGTPTLKNWRFKTRFFASFLFAFEKK